ncbi:sodium channel protein 1 brain-like isoform X2 [Stegodyphus dumicola]|uniref:sodium channel protein 1 brain-like isoform X2 n=1 Tax=Stegodyphus dumicola TaxID=202533 RepID=UPI0015ADD061|nr:sodium channel protein 1 brain-like isoform X2 [Stegodyphus dumicola]
MMEINDAEANTSQAPSGTSNSNTKPQFLEKMVQSIAFECIATVIIMGSCVVMVSVLEIILISVSGQLHGATSVKLLRALRPLRFIPRWKGMQMAVQALLLSFPAIFRVLGVCMFIWLSFAVLGVHFFSGNFFRCVDSNHEMVTEPIVDKDDCIQKNLIWEEPFFTFDHIGISYLSLSQLAMLTGWTGLVQMMVDFKDRDLQPEENSRQEYYIFVVVFILVGGFFSLNLIVGVVVDTFKNKQKHVDDGVTELLLTDAQKGYYNSLLKLSTRRPKVQTEAPTSPFLFFFYKVAYSLWFRVLILLFICTNTVIIALESYNDSPLKQKILSFCNIVFTIIYIIELAIKLLGLRKFYFKDFWNNFDLVILLAHLAGMLLHTALKISTGHAQLTFLYVFRLFRVLRLLRLTESLTDLRHLLYSMIASVPALLNISLLLLLIIFIYAIIGMSLFANVEYHGAIGPKINFETALNSMLLLFRLTTSEGWEDILQFISTEKMHCNPSLSNNCELMTAATMFMMSFLFLTNIILVNIFIAVILDNYKEVVAETKSIINEDNLIGFYRIWKQFDPRATQFIPYENLSDFLNQLDKELRIPKPNDIAVSFMNLPIAQGNKVHCLSVLKGILKIKIGNIDDSATFQNLCNKIQGKYEKMFPELKGFRFIETTMQLKRRDHAARIIQMHLRKMRNAKLRKSSLSQ